MADHSGESSGDESMEAAAGEAAAGEAAAGEAAVAGKKPRGAVVKTIECPSGCGAIELTKLRPVEVQCDECGVFVSHTWIENFGTDKKDVTRLRENHVRNINDEKNRKPSTEAEREKSKEYMAKSRAKQRAERIAEELPEHQALYDGMTPKHRAKYDFPRDTHPEDMTKEERAELRKYKGAVANALKYAANLEADEEGMRAKQRATRDAKPEKTLEEMAEHNEYMKDWWADHPEKRKANDDAGNAKKKEKREEAREAEDMQLPVVVCPACYGVVAVTTAKNRLPLRILKCDAEGCATFFSSQWPMEIFGEDRDEVERHIKREEAKASRAGWTDEQKEADKAKDKAKNDKMMADKAAHEKEKERCRAKAQKKRDETKANPEAYAQSLLDNQARHDVRRLPGGDEESTPESRAKRNAAYAENGSVGALAASDPEELEQVRLKRHEKYMREVAEGRAYYQLNGGTECPNCGGRHWSKTHAWCRDCRNAAGHAKVYETEVANFFRDNDMICSSSDKKMGCAGKGADTNVRPDFVFKAPGAANIVIVEVDEDQHRSYPIECEIARMAKVRDEASKESVVGTGAIDSPGNGIIVIRYNPEKTELGHRKLGDQAAITSESKELLLAGLRQALQAAPSESVLGYEHLFLGYDESRVVMFLHTELRMHAEGLESFGSSSSNTINDTVDLLVQHNDDFINRVRELMEKAQRLKKEERARRHAKRQADLRAAKKIK